MTTIRHASQVIIRAGKQKAKMSLITEIEGDLFDAPNGAVLIRTSPRSLLQLFVCWDELFFLLLIPVSVQSSIS